jgi:tetratricopeptide (TPR) repeat protein
MVETSGDAIAAPLSEDRVSEGRRTKFDFALAGCICLAAICYWSWDSHGTVPSAGTQAASASSPPPSQPMEKDASSSNDFNATGFHLYSVADYVGAEAQFRKAIRASPKAAVGFSNLGAALIAERRFDEAIAMLRIAISLDPSLTLARNNLNWAQEEKAKRAR